MTPLRILVVDDEPMLVALLARALQSQGFEVQSAHSAEQAIQLCSAQLPDALVVDLTLPRLSGLELAQWVKQHGATPVILMTGHDLSGADLTPYGVDLVKIKPFDFMEFSRQLCATLASLAPAISALC